MKPINIAIVGLGNCASSLIQGLHYYRDKAPEEVIGLMHWDIARHTPSDIRVSAAFDIDARRVGNDVHEAIFAGPACTTVFQAELPPRGLKLQLYPIMAGYAEHMSDG